MTDDIEIELTGLVTLALLNQVVRSTLSDSWYLDLPKFRKEMKDRIVTVNNDPRHRLFKLPVIYKGEISYNG